MEKLDTNKFSLAAAITMGIIYFVCAVFVILWPDFAIQLLGWLVHLVNLNADVQITFTGFIFGLIQVLIYTYIGALVFAWLHNRFLKR